MEAGETVERENTCYYKPVGNDHKELATWRLQINVRSGQTFPSSGHLPNPSTEPGSPALQADSLPSEPPGNTYI